MKFSIPNPRISAVYTVREAAWLLGVDPSDVSRLIRTGVLPAVRRRSRLVVPAHALARLLDEPAGTSPPTTSGGDER